MCPLLIRRLSGVAAEAATTWWLTTPEAGAAAEDPEAGGDDPEGGSAVDAPLSPPSARSDFGGAPGARQGTARRISPLPSGAGASSG